MRYAAIEAGDHVPTADQRVVMHNVPWEHVLRQGSYVRARKSGVFSGLDLPLLQSFLDRETALQAIRAYRDALRRRPSGRRRRPVRSR